MALLCRVKQVKLNQLSHHFKRCYLQNRLPRLVSHGENSQAGADYCCCYHTSNQINRSAYQMPVRVFNNRVRFFAVPVQVLKKEPVKEPSGQRINEQIKAEFVRIVTDEGHWVVSRREALERANNLKLDLVEVDRSAKPPVCKIMDYHKERYKKQVKEKERVKSKLEVRKGDCKEVRFSAKTELKDLKMKADTTKRLMERGYRVKCMVTGTEDQDLSGLISQLSALIEDIAVIESGPRVEKRQAYIIVRHVKFGPDKKAGKKAATFSSQPRANEEEICSGESGLDNDDEVDKPLLGQEQTSWSVSDTSHDFDKMFDKQVKFDPREAASSANTAPVTRVPNFQGSNVRPPSQELENRYARQATKTAPGARDTRRSPNYGGQPQPHFNVRPPVDPRQAPAEASASRNFRIPQNENRHGRGELLNRAGPHEPHSNHSKPHHLPQTPKQESRSSQSTGFGVFSTSKAHASGVRVSDPGRIPGDRNSPASKSDDSQRSEVNDGKKWGIFSRESSNSMPRKNGQG